MNFFLIPFAFRKRNDMENNLRKSRLFAKWYRESNSCLVSPWRHFTHTQKEYELKRKEQKNTYRLLMVHLYGHTQFNFHSQFPFDINNVFAILRIARVSPSFSCVLIVRLHPGTHSMRKHTERNECEKKESNPSILHFLHCSSLLTEKSLAVNIKSLFFLLHK